MKKVLKSSRDWDCWKRDYFEKKIYIQSEAEKSPKEYPCVAVETKKIKACEHMDDQFVRFVYKNDFPEINIKNEKIKNIKDEN